MTQARAVIAGGGIAGMALALTLHQIGVPCTIYEAARKMRPLGVGINLQPNAVRELGDMGIGEARLSEIGLSIREWALVGLNGREVYAEPRGREAGYHWPQYAVHRGEFLMLLYREVLRRLGPEAVRLGARVIGYRQTAENVTALIETRDRARHEDTADLLVGADGIHSAVRARMHPDQPPIHWGGALLWRGVVRAKALRTGASFVGLGTHRHRMVIYPISAPDEHGLSLINWIAEVTVESQGEWPGDQWFREVDVESFASQFDAFRYDWLDVPAMLRAAPQAFENPMIDRDPVPTWADGRVALIGDAAHAMYPTGSNGASQAIVDGRVFAAKLLSQGVSAAAVSTYDAELCGPVSELVLRNRGAGPFGLLNVLDARCGGVFDDIDAVIPKAERTEYMAGYKAAAGFAIDTLNAAQPTVPPGARVNRL